MMQHRESLLSLRATKSAKNVYFYKDGDYNFKGVRVAISNKKHPNIDALMSELSDKMPDLSYGVRRLTTPLGQHKITDIDELVNNGKYICKSRESHIGMDVSRVQNHRPWRVTRPSTGYRTFYDTFKDDHYVPVEKRSSKHLGADAMYLKTTNTPKKITVLLNGEPTTRHVVLLNRKTAQTFEQVLSDLSSMFCSSIRRLYTVYGERMNSLSSVFNGPDVVVAAGNCKFKESTTKLLSQAFVISSTLTSKQSVRFNEPESGDARQTRRERLQLTKGNWKIKIQTNNQEESGSDAQIMLTVYGVRGTSATIPLGVAGAKFFNSGQIDVFNVNVGKIGEIYKIRLSHDNLGNSPDWLCDEIKMLDINTGEKLVFPCNKWLSDRHELGETTRELPVVRPGIVPLPVLHYEVRITIGDVWNGGSDSTLYLTVYGERGDTGVRRFSKHQFVKGQTHIVNFEAVSLGNLKKVTVGHDAVGAGKGLYLEKIEIKELTHSPENVLFYCGRWLDEGEDDGKTFRNIHACYEAYSDIVSKRMWELEKWKYSVGSHVVLYNRHTGKAVRINDDSMDVDALGLHNHASSVFHVRHRNGPACVFENRGYPDLCLFMDKGLLIAKYSRDAYTDKMCELRVHIRSDRAITLESVKSPKEFASFLVNGQPTKSVRPRHDLSSQFTVMPRNMFIDGNVIMLFTSANQTLSIDQDRSMYATGKRSQLAQFMIHTTDKDNVYMLESVSFIGSYLCMGSDKVYCKGDGNGDECHFVIEVRPREGCVSLYSPSTNLYVGMTSDGHVKPTQKEYRSNVKLWPEIIKLKGSRPSQYAEYHRTSTSTNLGIPSRVIDSSLTTVSNDSPEMIFHLPRERTSTPRDEVSPDNGKQIKSSFREEHRSDNRRMPWVKIGALMAFIAAGRKYQLEILTRESTLLPRIGVVLCGKSAESNAFCTNRRRDPSSSFTFEMSSEVDVGDLNKVRLNLIDETPITVDISNVILRDKSGKDLLASNKDKKLEINDFNDGVLELPAMQPDGTHSLVLNYEVCIEFGASCPEASQCSLYITISGEEGTTACRQLKKPTNNKAKCLENDVNIFVLHAVNLGMLSSVEISHDNSIAGHGMFCRSVVVTEQNLSTMSYTFPCNQWLDTGRSDGAIRRLLFTQNRQSSKDSTKDKSLSNTDIPGPRNTTEGYDDISRDDDTSSPRPGGQRRYTTGGYKKSSRKDSLYVDLSSPTYQRRNTMGGHNDYIGIEEPPHPHALGPRYHRKTSTEGPNNVTQEDSEIVSPRLPVIGRGYDSRRSSYRDGHPDPIEHESDEQVMNDIQELENRFKNLGMENVPDMRDADHAMEDRGEEVEESQVYYDNTLTQDVPDHVENGSNDVETQFDESEVRNDNLGEEELEKGTDNEGQALEVEKENEPETDTVNDGTFQQTETGGADFVFGSNN